MSRIEAIAQAWRNRPGRVTGALHALQQERGYLEEDSVRQLAEALDVPLSQVYAVATFFAAYRLSPRGERHIQVCQGTACHVRGSVQIMEKLERELHISAGETSQDGLYSLETVRCLGCCGQAPVVRVNETAYGRLKQSHLKMWFRSIGRNDENTVEE